MEETPFHDAYTQEGKYYTKRLAYTLIVKLILEYLEVCWNPYREGMLSACNRVQNKSAKFANNINKSGWETVAQRRLIAPICVLFKAYTGRRA
jgi:hypothetical protein